MSVLLFLFSGKKVLYHPVSTTSKLWSGPEEGSENRTHTFLSARIAGSRNYVVRQDLVLQLDVFSSPPVLNFSMFSMRPRM